MIELLNYVEQLSDGQKLLWLVTCLSIGWVLEALMPLIHFDYNKLKHIGVNLVFTATTLLINMLFGLLTVGIFHWMNVHQFGLLYLVDYPLWLELLLAILFLDLFAQYAVHFLLHKISWMWRLHMVHHSDTYVDTTTGTRHHPCDYFMREIFALLAIVCLGLPFAFYLLYRLLTVFFTYLTHANIALPTTIDRLLSYLFVTPNMHKFHHHHAQPWTDSNYGNIFSVWDRLFGTLVYDDPKKIRYGLDSLDDSTAQSLNFQFKLPFQKTN